ncbi:uncharacterized protein BXIN_1088 [Babesia sp. Xinjiang]|uniref:uncharacterized protein n=1 Tax=Babesia sp. Xinjiang TaxID=462227 RepID=UPI000A252BD8|nr:uncharacterized protein BXIN_1088 [Babesia sp. Xinjiang]ORM42284.1 hypothetical protein BXIN_1088 [Babesia sp. Xinjiang]
MTNKSLALAFIGRIGLENLKDPGMLAAVKDALTGIQGEMEDNRWVNTALNEHKEDDWGRQNEADVTIPSPNLRSKPAAKNHANVTEVEMLLQILQEREQAEEDRTGNIMSARQFRNTNLLLAARELIIQAKDKTAWTSILERDQDENEKVQWEGMTRLIALIVLTMTMEKGNATDNSMVVALLSNHIKNAFRYSFQSPKSDLCQVEHPEWAMQYLKDVVKRYQTIFKLIKQEINSNTNELFDALIPGSGRVIPEENKRKLRDGFRTICSEFQHSNFVRKWMLAIAKEARTFVFSRLPLLIYEYKTVPSNKLLNIYQVTNITRTASPQTKLNVSRTLFDNERRANVMYNLLRAIMELSALFRTVDQAPAYEVFADFDQNNMVPCLGLKFDPEKNISQFELNYDHGEICGALDVLISLENTTAKKITKNLLNEENIMESIRCNNMTQNRWFLQDSGYITQPLQTLIALLKIFDERCKCLETTESRSKFTNKVIAPIVNSYIEYIKGKWNAEDDVFRSCSLTAFLVDATALLHEFLLKYPYTQYMSQAQATVERVLNRMISIIGDCVYGLIEKPFGHIHDRHVHVVQYIKQKFIQMAVQCSVKSYKQMLNSCVESVEKRLLAVLIPQRVNKIILDNKAHIEMAIDNW